MPHCRIMQPPGGSSNLFGESEDTAEEETKTPVKRPDRWDSWKLALFTFQVLLQDEVEL